MPYIPHSADDLRAMLAAIGVKNVDALFEDIPKHLRMKKTPRLPRPITELELQCLPLPTFDRLDAVV